MLIRPSDDSILRFSSASIRGTERNLTVDFLSPMIEKTRVSFPIIWYSSSSSFSSGIVSCPHANVEKRRKQIVYRFAFCRIPPKNEKFVIIILFHLTVFEPVLQTHLLDAFQEHPRVFLPHGLFYLDCSGIGR